MSTELFINKSLLPFLIWLTLSMFLLGIILTALDKLRIERKARTRVYIFDALDQRIHGLLQDLPEPHFPEGLPPQLEQMFRQEQALGNDVVRLGYNAVTEGERVLEQYQADLKAKGE